MHLSVGLLHFIDDWNWCQVEQRNDRYTECGSNGISREYDECEIFNNKGNKQNAIQSMRKDNSNENNLTA